MIDWVRQRANVTRRLTSVCSGAFILAATGLLNGRRATTHWYNCAALAAIFPEVRVEPDPIYINDGAIWTSAGVTAGIDMAARVIERMRVEAARQALSAARLPMKRIARDCGFGTEDTMRRSFMRVLGVTPRAYRDRFSN